MIEKVLERENTAILVCYQTFTINTLDFFSMQRHYLEFVKYLSKFENF